MATRRAKNDFSTLLENWGGRKKDLDLQKSNIRTDTLSTAEFWKIGEAIFIRIENITFNRHVFLIAKHLRVETVKHCYGKFKKLAENFDFEKKKETLIRDFFITNLIDPEIQIELFKQTVQPRQTLELAINMEIGMQNQSQIQQHNETLIPASVNAIQFPSNSRSSNWSLSNNFHKQGNHSHLYFRIVETG